MTNPNWWDVEPYCEDNYPIIEGRTVLERRYNVPLIIAEVQKRGETTAHHDIASEAIAGIYTCKNCLAKQIRNRHLFCPHCGATIRWDNLKTSFVGQRINEKLSDHQGVTDVFPCEPLI